MAGSGKPFDFNQFLSSMKMQKGEEAPPAANQFGVPTARMGTPQSAQPTARMNANDLPTSRLIPAPTPAAAPAPAPPQHPAAEGWPGEPAGPAAGWEAPQAEYPQAETQWPQEAPAQGQWENHGWDQQAQATPGWEEASPPSYARNCEQPGQQGWSDNQWSQQQQPAQEWPQQQPAQEWPQEQPAQEWQQQPSQEWPQHGHEQQWTGQEQQHWQGGDWSGGEQQQWTGHDQGGWENGGHHDQQQWGPDAAQWEPSETGWEQHSGWSEGQQQQPWSGEQGWGQEPQHEPQAQAAWPQPEAPPQAPDTNQPWSAPVTRTPTLSTTPSRLTLIPSPPSETEIPPVPPAAPAPAPPAPAPVPVATRIEPPTPAPPPQAEPRPVPAPAPATAKKKPPASRIKGIDPEVCGKMVRLDLSLKGLLEQLVAIGGSDLHLSAGVPPCFRVKGDIEPQNFAPLTAQEIEEMLFPVMNEEQKATFLETNDLDFAMELPGLARFRVNFARQYRGMVSCMRIIPKEIPNLAQLGLPAAIDKICRIRRGMIIVTGPTGSGKSTTLAAMINEINQQRQAHIITIEDPIEFVHESKKCLITHREIGQHAVSFADAIRAAVREDPDIVLVGEMRDLDTVSQAVKAAEMGLLVLATLHTNNAAKAVDRIIDIFPAEDQEQIRVTLSEALKGVVAQQLLKRADGKGRVAVHEILMGTPALSNLIRDAKTHQIPGVIQTGRDMGMQLMDQGLIDLIQKGLITPEIAREKASDPRNFQRAGITL